MSLKESCLQPLSFIFSFKLARAVLNSMKLTYSIRMSDIFCSRARLSLAVTSLNELLLELQQMKEDVFLLLICLASCQSLFIYESNVTDERTFTDLLLSEKEMSSGSSTVSLLMELLLLKESLTSAALGQTLLEFRCYRANFTNVFPGDTSNNNPVVCFRVHLNHFQGDSLTLKGILLQLACAVASGVL